MPATVLETWEQSWLLHAPPEDLLRQVLAVHEATLRPSPATAGWPKVRVSDRKLRLIGCGLCRTMSGQGDPRSGAAILAAEKYADSKGDLIYLRHHRGRMTSPDLYPSAENTAVWMLVQDQVSLLELLPLIAAADVSLPLQVQVIRDIFGNPFRPVSFCPSWRTSDVLRLARLAYEQRDEDGNLHPDILAALSDALEEAGCADQALLDHLREEGAGPQGGIDYHFRGCWALDAALGKS